MKKHLYSLILLISIFASGQITWAGHLIGAELTYRQVGKDSFEVQLIVYRDCNSTNFNTVNVDAAGTGCGTQSKSLKMVSCKDITPLCSTACSKCQSSSCNSNSSNAGCSLSLGLEKLVYIDTFVFTNASCCNIRFIYSPCCRSNFISTCCASEGFYTYAELNRCVSGGNSSPVFTNIPRFIVPTGDCLFLSHQAKDSAENDSLSYHLSPAYNSFNSKCSYQGSYNEKEPIYYDGFPKKPKPPIPNPSCKGFFLDSIMGFLQFKAMQNSSAVIVIDVKEWRKDTNGVYKQIGLIRRDYTLYALNANGNKVPQIQGPVTQNFCIGGKLCFGPYLITDGNINQVTGTSTDSLTVNIENNLPNATVNSYFDTSIKAHSYSLCWNSDSSQVGTEPYLIKVSVKDRGCPYVNETYKEFKIFLNPEIKDSMEIKPLGCGRVHLKSIIDTNIHKKTPLVEWYINPGGYKIVGTDTIITLPQGRTCYIEHHMYGNNCKRIRKDSVVQSPTYFWISLGRDTSVCKGETIELKSDLFNNVGKVKFRWNNSQVDTLSSLKVIGAFSTTYLLEAWDSAGCYSSDQIYVYVKNQIYKPTYVVGSNYISVDSKLNPGAIVNWIYQGNILPFTNYIIYPQDTGIYTFKLTNSVGCTWSTDIEFYHDPLVNIGNDTSICEGKTIQLQSKITDGKPPYRYAWQTGNPADTLSSLFIQPNFSLNFVCKVTDSRQKTAWDTVFVGVRPVPTMASIQRIHNFIWHDSSSTTYLPSWQKIGQPNIHPFYGIYPNDSGTYRFTLTDKSNGCQLFQDYFFYPMPTVDLGNDTNVCRGNTLLLQPAVKGIAPFQYRWSPQDTLPTLLIAPYSDTMIVLTITSGPGLSSSDTLNVNVYNNPPTVSIIEVPTLLYVDSAMLSSYQPSWSLNGVDLNNPWFSLTPTQPGVYNLKLVNQWGCYANSVYVYQLNGIHDIAKQHVFNVFPNPAQGKVEIQTGRVGIVELYDLQGKLVKSAQTTGQLQWSVAELTEGKYQLIFIEQNQKVEQIWLDIRR